MACLSPNASMLWTLPLSFRHSAANVDANSAFAAKIKKRYTQLSCGELELHLISNNLLLLDTKITRANLRSRFKDRELSHYSANVGASNFAHAWLASTCLATRMSSSAPYRKLSSDFSKKTAAPLALSFAALPLESPLSTMTACALVSFERAQNIQSGKFW